MTGSWVNARLELFENTGCVWNTILSTEPPTTIVKKLGVACCR